MFRKHGCVGAFLLIIFHQNIKPHFSLVFINHLIFKILFDVLIQRYKPSIFHLSNNVGHLYDADAMYPVV
ncbi:hypothetical protein WM45_24410 [Citrobacter sp. AATXR]|uniref:Uncharacterized protein n=1 Tax=Citrobacter freundii TaxID=546 RepID=A0AA44NNW3_CITFR|nr:hypothetical protein CfB38_2226 [Citrobacter freundii]KYC14329.1 hypothetical protein WM45_24410 [Citrobacter sp. AATXR]OYR00533.1 hypothetical protein B9P90_01390 [Citrobacter freundii]OYR06554.1 hypothetical protein B9P89_03295 [Citrobacter freundii]